MGKLKLRKLGAYRKPQILTLNYGWRFSQEPIDMKCVWGEGGEKKGDLAKEHANKGRD